jgi:WD40 repeat protein
VGPPQLLIPSVATGPAPQPLYPGPLGSRWASSGAGKRTRFVAVADVASATLVDRDGDRPPLKLGVQGRLRACQVSPDGEWVVTSTVGSVGSSKPVRVWNATSGQNVADLPLSGDTWWLLFSPDGHWLATYDTIETRLWEVGSWEAPVRRWEGSVVFSPDGKLMAINDGIAGSVRLVRTGSGEEVARLTGPERNKYWPQCFTPDGTKLFALGEALCVWDLRLIREQLRARGLDWELPPFPVAGAGTPRRISLTVDTGTFASGEAGAASTRPQEPASGPDHSK